MLSVDMLMEFLKLQKDQRGLEIDIPKFQLKRIRGKMTSQLIHEKTNAHVQIPWIRSQRLKPSEASVLIVGNCSLHSLTCPSNSSLTVQLDVVLMPVY